MDIYRSYRTPFGHLSAIQQYTCDLRAKGATKGSETGQTRNEGRVK